MSKKSLATEVADKPSLLSFPAPEAFDPDKVPVAIWLGRLGITLDLSAGS